MSLKINKRKLASVRALFGLTMQDVSDILKITSATYSRKENGENDFRLIEAKAITDYINTLDDDREWIIEDIFF